MRSAEPDVRRPKSIATAGRPFAMPFHGRACDRDEAENLEDVDARASLFVARRCAAGSGRAWLHDRRQAPRQTLTLRLDEDARAWWRRDDRSSPYRQASLESATAQPLRSDGQGL